MAVLIFFFAAFCFLFSPNNIFASDNLLSNPDFESWDGEIPSNWTKKPSTLNTSSSDDSHAGAKGVLFENSSNSTKYLCQIVSVTPLTNYHLSGWTKTISGSGNSYLRATQRTDSNCGISSGELKFNDSAHVISTSWKELSIDFTTSDQAKFVEIKPSLTYVGSGTLLTLWDDLNLTISGVSPSPSPSSSPSSTSTKTQTEPKINFSPPSNLPIGTTLSIPIQASNLPVDTYYIKVRIGPDQSHLSHGQTFNGSSWLSDTGASSSWVNFPKTTNGSSWQGSINARLPSGKPAGSYKILIKFTKTTDTSVAYESEIKDIQFLPEEKTETPPPPSKIPTPTILTASEPVLDASVDGKILGESTPSSDPDPPQSPKKVPTLIKSSVSQQKLPIPIKDLLISLGLFILGFSGVWFFRSRNLQQNGQI